VAQGTWRTVFVPLSYRDDTQRHQHDDFAYCLRTTIVH